MESNKQTIIISLICLTSVFTCIGLSLFIHAPVKNKVENINKNRINSTIHNQTEIIISPMPLPKGEVIIEPMPLPSPNDKINYQLL